MEAIKIIEPQPKCGPYVFGYNDKPFGNINKHWLKLGLDRTITQHTLRHSFASLAADLGYSDNVIARMLGHARSSITSRYVHLELALIKAANSVAQETLRFDALLSIVKNTNVIIINIVQVYYCNSISYML
jgi:integrase